MNQSAPAPAIPFTRYQIFAIAILAFTQFTVILDFMIMAPMGDLVMKGLDIKPGQFGTAVSAYAFSAGIAGLLTAGFADKFDRKKLLLFFYLGFILGTVFCGLAHTYPLLVAARIVAGLFGGVIGSISAAIVADLFTLQQRGRVMGYLQMALGASQVMGVPIGLYLADAWGWNLPFMAIAAVAGLAALLIATLFHPVTAHLAQRQTHSAIRHLVQTLGKADYRLGFAATALLSIGAYMMMPFGSAFAVNNLKIAQADLPIFFMINGVFTLFFMPLVGRLSDKVDKFTLFAFACVWMTVVVLFYTHLGPTAFWVALGLNILMMMGIGGRMIPAMALMSAVPAMQDRGAYMSVNASMQQITGGIAAAIAGMIIVQPDKSGPLLHYNWLGYVMIGATAVSVFLVYRVSRMLKVRAAAAVATVPAQALD